MIVEVELDDEQCECVTSKELWAAVDLNMSPYQGDCPAEPDWELIDALVLVLRYFSAPSDKAQFDRVEENIIKLKGEFECGS